MATIPNQQGDFQGDSVATMKLLAQAAGGAVSLAIVAGIAWWGYDLVMRDVSGVPVVRALEGPMRVAPEDPGGEAAENQGLSVNHVAGTGTVEPAPERLMLAPPEPGITEKDPTGAAVPKVALNAIAGSASGEEIVPVRPLFATTPVEIRPVEEAAPTAATDTGEPPVTIRPTLRPAQDGAAGIAVASEAPAQPAAPSDETASLAPAVNAGAGAPGVEAALREALATPDAPGPARSLRPQPRPVRAATALPAAPAASADDGDLAAVAPGTVSVQFGAYDSPEIARREWGRLEARFGDFLAGKSRVIQKTVNAGRELYRLRAVGFADMADARRFCSAIEAGGADCIPVTWR